ncbi:MAG: restriction endonuclease subunit S [Erysipelotrichaceae bacterium]|nr:restriction endonuclease subunit S [Erysipelotrichaceae bacterium]
MHFVKLKDICTDIVDCPHSTPVWNKEKGIRVIRNFNLKNGALDFTDGYYVDKETFLKRTKRAVPEELDIVISREAPMGTVAIIPKGLKCCLGQRLVLLKVNKSLCNPFYLLEVLMSDYVQKQFKIANSTGSIVSNLCIPDLMNITIPIIDNQNQVANILQTLSSKIQLNRNINDNLAA